jgi:hypothetical protein
MSVLRVAELQVLSCLSWTLVESFLGIELGSVVEILGYVRGLDALYPHH